MFELEFEDTFEGGTLSAERWLPYYLPHWSTRELARARYRVGGGRLQLRIEEDQEPWCPELDGIVRVSSLQTGTLDGQHRFHPAARVQESQPPLRLYTPRYGRFELRARATDDPSAMAALWMVGYEDAPERSAEICVCEIFGREAGASEALVGMGLHPFGDPAIADDFSKLTLPIDVREPHEYAAEWLPDSVTFLVDGAVVKTVAQSPSYPMQLMLGIYAFGEAPPHPKVFEIESVRGYRLSA